MEDGNIDQVYQVAVDKWYKPPLTDLTYPTRIMRMTRAQALALIFIHHRRLEEVLREQEKRGAPTSQSAPPTICEHCSLIDKKLRPNPYDLDSSIQSLLKDIDQHVRELGIRLSSGCFVKLNHRSPKDVVLKDYLLDVFEREVHKRVVQRGPTGELEYLLDADSNTQMLVWFEATATCLRVRSGGEAVQLLMLSQRVHEDLCHDIIHSDQQLLSQLIIREFVEPKQAMEFRGFISNGKLTAISQCHTQVIIPRLMQDKNQVKDHLVTFFEDIVIPGVREVLPDVRSFCADVVVTYIEDVRSQLKNRSDPDVSTTKDLKGSQDSAKRTLDVFGYSSLIVELNPFEDRTSTYLFSWAKDRNTLLNGPFEFRVQEGTPQGFERIPDSHKRVFQQLLNSAVPKRQNTTQSSDRRSIVNTVVGFLEKAL